VPGILSATMHVTQPCERGHRAELPKIAEAQRKSVRAGEENRRNEIIAVGRDSRLNLRRSVSLLATLEPAAFLRFCMQPWGD